MVRESKHLITIRCTRKLLKYLGTEPIENPKPPTGILGDWYANLIPTVAGALIIFVNERSLLTVAVPDWEAENLIPVFGVRVVNLFAMIGVSAEVALRELRHYDSVQFSKTASRSILGSMNDFAWHYQIMAEEGQGKRRLSLSDAEFKLSQMPCSPLGYRYPSDVAIDLLHGMTDGDS